MRGKSNLLPAESNLLPAKSDCKPLYNKGLISLKYTQIYLNVTTSLRFAAGGGTKGRVCCAGCDTQPINPFDIV